jgi:hypothetical protein
MLSMLLDELAYWHSLDPLLHSMILAGALLMCVAAVGAILMNPGRSEGRWTYSVALLALIMIAGGYFLSNRLYY